jgi:repressor LexA
MTVGEKIKLVREAKNIAQVDLATQAGISKQTLYKYENGIITNIPSNKIEAIAKVLETTPAYLMGWDESVYIDYSEIKNIMPFPNMKKVPLLGTIACGEPITAEENIETYLNMPDNIKGTFALRCKGDSMINARIFDGDIVFIREQPDVENGEIAAVLIDNEATLKRVFKYDNRLELRAENPTFKSLNYEGEQLADIRILGKAVGFLSTVI